jgi:hypothetical protein
MSLQNLYKVSGQRPCMHGAPSQHTHYSHARTPNQHAQPAHPPATYRHAHWAC